MTPAAPPFLPNPFRIPARRPAQRPAAAWWLVPNRDSGASWQLVGGDADRNSDEIKWIN